MKQQITWQLVNPTGVVNVKPLKAARYPETLEGKNVLLRWNGKHNGDAFLSRIGGLLTQKVKGVKIIKSWEVAHETAAVSNSQNVSEEFARKLADFKPDIAIGSQGD